MSIGNHVAGCTNEALQYRCMPSSQTLTEVKEHTSWRVPDRHGSCRLVKTSRGLSTNAPSCETRYIEDELDLHIEDAATTYAYDCCIAAAVGCVWQESLPIEVTVTDG